MTMHRDDRSIIEDLRTNLKERYHFEGGRTLLRELLQNADDSGSEQVRIAVLPGWPEADHPLLRVPGLMVANDGRYDAESAQGIARFGGSIKATDTAAIGRFGMGQKTAFHVCDAFLVVSDGHDTEVPSLVVNPYIVIGKPGDACVEWKAALTTRDRDLLLSSGLAGSACQMVQWYPLRSPTLKPKTTTSGFLPKSYDTSLLDDANDPFWLSGIVSLLRNVQKLEVIVTDGTSSVIDRADDVRLTDRHVFEFCRTLAEEYVGSVKDQPEAREALDALLAGRARFAEHVASAVRAEIRDQMPKILGEMKPRPGGSLERARKDYEDAVRGAGDGADAIRQGLKDQLWTKVDQPAGHKELLERVRARITEDGYAPVRIFFELFQNADDAWQQDPAWTDAPGRFELSRDRGTTTMNHWGRLINVVDAGNHGERMGWHRDLYHMLLLNLSDKDRAEAVTGKFGLGFKAVHLLADQVWSCRGLVPLL